MKLTRRVWTTVLISVCGILLATATKPTAAYGATSSSNQKAEPAVGVLFSNGFTYARSYLHHYFHHAGGRAVSEQTPPTFFDPK